MSFQDDIQRIEVFYPYNIIIGDKYDLKVSKWGHSTHLFHTPLLLLDCTYMRYRNDGDGTVNKLVFQCKHGNNPRNWYIEHNPNNHIYKRATVGDIVSTLNPNKAQRDAARRALAPLSRDPVAKISTYGGNKKKTRKIKSLKNKKSKKRTRKNKKSKKKKPRKKLI